MQAQEFAFIFVVCEKYISGATWISHKISFTLLFQNKKHKKTAFGWTNSLKVTP